MMLLEAQLEKQAESTLYAQEITEVSFTPSRSRRRHTLLVYRLMFIRYRIAIRSKMMFVCVCVCVCQLRLQLTASQSQLDSAQKEAQAQREELTQVDT